MRESLQNWIADAETQRTAEAFVLPARMDRLAYLDGRSFDLYVALLGQLVDLLRDEPANREEWAVIGGAFAVAAEQLVGRTRSEALVFGALSFYRGGYAASATLTARDADASLLETEHLLAVHDLLTRAGQPRSRVVDQLETSLRVGDMSTLDELREGLSASARDALAAGPDEWISHSMLTDLLERFSYVNLRAVLPGDADRWNDLVLSMLDRSPPVWEFFPSQIEAIEADLLTSSETYALQMPTGAGKTALTETLIYDHLVGSTDRLAVLLVPYRALARELRWSLARRLDDLGLRTRTVYGGTVPPPEESQDLSSVRAIVATPEAFSGLLGRVPELRGRLSLVVCDEGHLLDQPGRGVGLELLLARLRLTGGDPPPRIVFLSAIVPNIEEINAWLGGTDRTVVRSGFRPAGAEFAVLRPKGTGVQTVVDLEMHSIAETARDANVLPGFLTRSDFLYINPATGRPKTHDFTTVKARAIGAARKALPMGSVAVFSAVKTGSRGVIGLADEVLTQAALGLKPAPEDFLTPEDRLALADVVEYLRAEFGDDWTGTEAIRAGVVLHHGDVPQETRETLEEVLASRHARMVICTSTLAEGVNLPIRTMILYGVYRPTDDSGDRPEPMLGRDIKNLVGRAGRAGLSTKGLVICANPSQWGAIEPVAGGQPVEDVAGALLTLVRRLRDTLALTGQRLTNRGLEGTARWLSLVDGIDAVLVEQATEETSVEALRAIAEQVAAQTFAAAKGTDTETQLLNQVFESRVERIEALRQAGRLGWARTTGARPRLIDSVVDSLRPAVDWAAIQSPLDDQLLGAFVRWVYPQPDFQAVMIRAFRPDPMPPEETVFDMAHQWLAGSTMRETAQALGTPVDRMLRRHTQVIEHSLTTLVEQGIALLGEILAEEDGSELTEAVTNLPDYLRHGVATPAGRALMLAGLRHRRAAVALAAALEDGPLDDDIIGTAGTILTDNEQTWEPRLGSLVYRRSLEDLARISRARSA